MNINDAGMIVVVCGDGATEFSLGLMGKVHAQASFALEFLGKPEFDLGGLISDGTFSDDSAAQIWLETVVNDMNRIADVWESGIAKSRVYAFDECDFKAGSEAEKIFKSIVDASDLVFVADGKEHEALRGSSLGRFAMNLSVDDAAQVVLFTAAITVYYDE